MCPGSDSEEKESLRTVPIGYPFKENIQPPIDWEQMVKNQS